MECGDFTLILQSGEKRAKIDLSQFTEEKPEPFPINTVFVPKQLLANVLQAGKEFCLGAKNLNPTTKDSAIGKGIQMIARQTQEVFADCHDGDTNIRVSTWIEKLLAVKDNLEYGIVSSERTTIPHHGFIKQPGKFFFIPDISSPAHGTFSHIFRPVSSVPHGCPVP